MDMFFIGVASSHLLRLDQLQSRIQGTYCFSFQSLSYRRGAIIFWLGLLPS